MMKRSLAVLLAICAFPAEAQQAGSATVIGPSVDTPEQRQSLRQLTFCLAKTRPSWARGTLAQPYLSAAQASSAAEALKGQDNCLRTAEKEMTFRTSTIVSALAEYFVRAEIGQTNLKRVANALATTTPLNVSEDFALCIAARDPTAALDLTLSEPGSSAENKAASNVAAYLSTCTNPGEHLNVDLQSLRALVSAALYRGISASIGSGN
jgi:hypothetical protein